jgi:hypothetical protein
VASLRSSLAGLARRVQQDEYYYSLSRQEEIAFTEARGFQPPVRKTRLDAVVLVPLKSPSIPAGSTQPLSTSSMPSSMEVCIRSGCLVPADLSNTEENRNPRAASFGNAARHSVAAVQGVRLPAGMPCTDRRTRPLNRIEAPFDYIERLRCRHRHGRQRPLWGRPAGGSVGGDREVIRALIFRCDCG